MILPTDTWWGDLIVAVLSAVAGWLTRHLGVGSTK